MRKRGRFLSDQLPLQSNVQERSKGGNVGGGEHEEQIPYIRQRFKRRGCWSERTLPAFVTVSVEGTVSFRTVFHLKHDVSNG